MILANIFRTLRYRNFRLFFFGQSLSLVGTWIQAVAMSWLVYRLTNSPFLLGLVMFATHIPIFILGPFAGVLADRFDRYRILILTQTLSMLQALLLAWLVLSGEIVVWQIIALGFFLGCINSLDIPVRQAFIVDMVERKENLSNAIALNSLVFNAARLVGPSVAGLIIALFGEGICFLINGFSFFSVLIALLMMKIKPKGKTQPDTEVFKKLAEGFRYAYGFLPIRYILMLLSVVSLMGMSYVVLMPVFARDVLGGGPGTFGMLMASTGVGALIATAYIAGRKTILGLGRRIPFYSSLFSISLILFSLSGSLWFSCLILAIAGFGLMSHLSASNIIMQTVVDDDKRGRIMSMYAMALLGVAPFGSLLAGGLAAKIGASNTLILGGAICMLSSFLFAKKRLVISRYIHPVYRKMGIIPEVASGIAEVTRLAVPPED